MEKQKKKKNNKRKLRIIGIIVFYFSIVGCSSLRKVSYECDETKQNAALIDTLIMEHSLLVTIHEGKNTNRLIIPDKLLSKIKSESNFRSVLKQGGFLMADEIQLYIPDFKSTTSINDFSVKKIRKIGNHSVWQFVYPFKKFIVINVTTGCYNKTQRTSYWIPLTGDGNKLVKILYPIKE